MVVEYLVVCFVKGEGEELRIYLGFGSLGFAGSPTQDADQEQKQAIFHNRKTM